MNDVVAAPFHAWAWLLAGQAVSTLKQGEGMPDGETVIRLELDIQGIENLDPDNDLIVLKAHDRVSLDVADRLVDQINEELIPKIGKAMAVVVLDRGLTLERMSKDELRELLKPVLPEIDWSAVRMDEGSLE